MKNNLLASPLFYYTLTLASCSTIGKNKILEVDLPLDNHAGNTACSTTGSNRMQKEENQDLSSDADSGKCRDRDPIAWYLTYTDELEKNSSANYADRRAARTATRRKHILGTIVMVCVGTGCICCGGYLNWLLYTLCLKTL